MIDTTVTLGNVLEMAILGVGFIGSFASLRNTVRYMDARLTHVEKKLDAVSDNKTRLDNQSERISRLEMWRDKIT